MGARVVFVPTLATVRVCSGDGLPITAPTEVSMSLGKVELIDMRVEVGGVGADGTEPQHP